VPKGDRSEDRHADHFREWLRHGMSGCWFARRLASQGSTNPRVAYWTRLGPLLRSDVPALDALLDQSATRGHFFVALFPYARSAEDIAQLVRTLARSERWKCRRVEWRKHARNECVLVGITWQTREGLPTSVMGFAPLGAMPVTRRAPIVALALWPGPHANPFRQDKRGPVIGFVDGAHGLNAVTYDSVWADTKASVQSLLAEPPEDAARLREAAFCLPSGLADCTD
jgi:hypothetical protein